METLDLTQILKDCPKGTMLYSPIFGNVAFVGVDCDRYYPIIVKSDDGDEETFTEEGKFRDLKGANCMLFPSKDNRDWSTFKPKPEPKYEHKFKPFDRVLVRNGDDECWHIDFFDHYYWSSNFLYRCMTRGYHRYCIPYEGNEHLCGTTDEPKWKEE